MLSGRSRRGQNERKGKGREGNGRKGKERKGNGRERIYRTCSHWLVCRDCRRRRRLQSVCMNSIGLGLGVS